MDIFISCSKDRSRKIAEYLNDWIPMVIQAVTPWISKDIDKGARWSPEISEKLAQSKIGIICLTPENIHNDWILFEAGALSKSKDTKVCTFLFELTPTDIEEPLAQFQHTIFSEEDFKKLIMTINTQIDHPLQEKTLTAIFDKNWPDLEDRIKSITPLQKSKLKKQERSERDILEEILELTRRQANELMRREEFDHMRRNELELIKAQLISEKDRHYTHSERRYETIRKLQKEFPILKALHSDFIELIKHKGLPRSEARSIIADKLFSNFSQEIPKPAIDIFLDFLYDPKI